MEELGVVDRLGNQKASKRVLLVTSLDCATCRESFKFLLPALRNDVIEGKAAFTVVNVMSDKHRNHSILEAKLRTKAVDPYLTMVLSEVLVNSFDQLGKDPSPGELLELADINVDLSHSGIDWSDRIKRLIKMSQKVDMSVVPLWFVNGERIFGDDLVGLRMSLKSAMEENSEKKWFFF